MSLPPGADHRPPRLAELLLSFVVPNAEAQEGLLGDLWEEFCEAATERSVGYANRWYWWCAVRITCRYALDRPRRWRDGKQTDAFRPVSGVASKLESFLRDSIYAGRTLRRTPGFTSAVVLILGLGVGASTTIFGVFNAVVLRPIPFTDPSRLVLLSGISPQGWDFAVSQPDFLDFRDRSRDVLDLAAFQPNSDALLGDSDSGVLSVVFTTSALFRVFKVSPLHGRVFAPDEERLGAPGDVVVLSHDLWVREFGTDPGVVGQTAALASGRYTVIGVMPAGFEVPDQVDLWLPRAPDPSLAREDRRLSVYGRLRDGVTLERATGEVRGIAAALAVEHPGTNHGWDSRLMLLSDWVVGAQARTITVLLLSAVLLLLLLISTNVSNLLMARTTTRHREIGIRCAIGAGRGRVVRQIFAESLLLALMGAGVGLLLAYVLVPVVASQPEILPRLSEVDIDHRVLAFAILVSVGEGLAIGLLPAIQTTRWKISDALAETGREATLTGRRVRDSLVMGEVAVAMTLLVGAGLLGHSFMRLQQVDRGFEADGLLAVRVALPPEHTNPEAVSLFEEALTELRRIRGVVDASGTSLRFFDLGPRLFTELGNTGLAQEDYVASDWRVVTDEYFNVAGVDLLAGRFFDRAAYGAGESQVIVNRTLAGHLWPDEDPLEKNLIWEGPGGDETRVVGVVADVQDIHPGLEQVASAYVPLRQVPLRAMTLLVRTGSDRTGLAGSMRRAIRRVSPTAIVSEVRRVEDSYREVVAQDRFLVAFLTVVAAVAVTLAGMGLYGLVAFTVARRYHEIGVRLALGGQPRSVLAMIIRHGLWLVLLGIGLGALAAVALSRLISALLFETNPTNPWIYFGVGGLLMVVTLVATYLPARRATQVDPRGVLAA